MKKLMAAMDKIDMFGVPITLLTTEKESSFQSKVGGMITIMLGSISFTYFLYVMILWSNNEIPPSVSIRQETIGYSQFNLQKAMINLTLVDFSNDLDPFRQQNNIITPRIYTMVDTKIVDPPLTLFSREDDPFLISLSNLTLILNNEIQPIEGDNQMKQYLLILESCSNNTMGDESYCADQNTIDTYLQKFHGFFLLSIRINQLNEVTNELEQFDKQYYTGFDVGQPQYSQVMLKQQETIIDNGFLFNKYHNYQFLNNYELINQQVESFFASKVVSSMSSQDLNFTSFGCYLFRLDNISVKELVTMPKLGEVLAQVGSIAQLIFILKYLAIFYNDKLLEFKLLHEIIIMYYPELKNVKLTIFNQYKIKDSPEYKLKFSIQEFRKIYDNLLKRAKEKCRLINILYEISRIQFIIQQQFGDQVLQQSHQLGGTIQNNYFDFENYKETNRLTVKPVSSVQIENDSQLQEPLEILLKQS